MPRHAPRRSSPTTWIDARRRAIDPDRARDPGAGDPQRGGTAYLCAADADGLLVSLIQSNFLALRLGRPRAGVGHQPQQPRLVVLARPGRPNAIAPGEATRCTRSSPRWRCATASRGSCSAAWAATRRPGPRAAARRTSSTTATTRRRDRTRRAGVLEPATGSVHVETRLRRADGSPASRALGHDDPSRPRAYDRGMGHAHAIGRTAARLRRRCRPTARRALRSGSEGRRRPPGYLDACPT